MCYADADYNELGRRTEGFSGSDVSVAVKDVLMQPIRLLREATHFRKVRGPDGGEWGSTRLGPRWRSAGKCAGRTEERMDDHARPEVAVVSKCAGRTEVGERLSAEGRAAGRMGARAGSDDRRGLVIQWIGGMGNALEESTRAGRR